jgi:regulator of sirC expression with transglutaminase-like and TPR domain
MIAPYFGSLNIHGVTRVAKGTRVWLRQAPFGKLNAHPRPRLSRSTRPQASSSNRGGSDAYSAIVFEDFQSAAKALQALEEYKILMQQPEPDFLTGAILIARHRYPNASLKTAEDILDDLAEQIIPKLPESRYPLKIVNTISQHLYQECGFSGAEDYYSPDNSCLNFVLEERQGIPITLSLVYMEVAKRCGFELHGVNLPGHFVLTPADPELEFFIDAYNSGQISFLDDAAETLENIYGRSVKIDPGFLQRKDQLPSRVFFTRMLNNLKAIYAARKDYLAALQMSTYLRATRPGDLDEIREYGYILYHLKRYAECGDALTEYLERAPSDAKDVVKVKKVLQKLRGASDGDELSGSDSGMDE